MSKIKEFLTVYTMGSVGYGALEILWRGFTHWSMVLTGGVCFWLIYLANWKFAAEKLWKKCLLGTSIITSMEFMVGCIVNRAFHWDVWDYSGQKFNLLGQICPLYSVLWFLLCIPLQGLTRMVHVQLKGKRHA